MSDASCACSPSGRKILAHGVSRRVLGRIDQSPCKGRKNLASGFERRVRADLTPPSGGSEWMTGEPTAHAVGYFLPPFGLGLVNFGGAPPTSAEVAQ